MTLYSRYLLTIALLFTGTTVLLAAYNQHNLDLYISLYLIEYLAATLVFAQLHPRARQTLNIMGIILFAGFLVIVAMKVLEILIGRGVFL